MAGDHLIDSVAVRAYRIPTEGPEQDGTYAWSATTLVVVHTESSGVRGLGYSYGSAAMVSLVREALAPLLEGKDALDVEGALRAMLREVRNIGRGGIAATAISAIDASLWDLKAKLLDLPLARLLGRVRDTVPVYGSGGFTNYSVGELTEQLGRWAQAGVGRVKMKVGAKPSDDVARVRAAREAIGRSAELMVDANGAYTRKQALAQAHGFAQLGVTWFEEPVSSDDLEGLRLLRDHAPAGLDIAAGEYGFDPFYFKRMLDAGAVDVLQADATRCLGISGFLFASRLCEAAHVPLSAHTAPSLHLHAACAAVAVAHVELFYDHARIERLLFDGYTEPKQGGLAPDLSRPGLGLELKTADAERFAIGEPGR
jgi:L-alanine-DL-glutamate epimerase-like enolase superfamily enzyme